MEDVDGQQRGLEVSIILASYVVLPDFLLRNHMAVLPITNVNEIWTINVNEIWTKMELG